MRLARAYAAAGRDGSAGPAVIRLNYGIQRSENGGTAARAVCDAAAVDGSLEAQGRRAAAVYERVRFRSTTRRCRCRS